MSDINNYQTYVFYWIFEKLNKIYKLSLLYIYPELILMSAHKELLVNIPKKRGRKPKQSLVINDIQDTEVKSKRGGKKKINSVEDDMDENEIIQDIQNIKLDENEKSIISKNIMIKERLITIDKILEMYPNLKKDRTLIVNNILNKKEQKIDDFILEKVTIDNKSYYFDPDGNIIDSDVTLMGFYVKGKDIDHQYYLFSDQKKRNDNLLKNIEKIKKY